jgi:hypothetical protein
MIVCVCVLCVVRLVTSLMFVVAVVVQYHWTSLLGADSMEYGRYYFLCLNRKLRMPRSESEALVLDF